MSERVWDPETEAWWISNPATGEWEVTSAPGEKDDEPAEIENNDVVGANATPIMPGLHEQDSIDRPPESNDTFETTTRKYGDTGRATTTPIRFSYSQEGDNPIQHDYGRSSLSKGIMDVVSSSSGILIDPTTGNVVDERPDFPNFNATRDACQGISMASYGGLEGCLREAVLRRYQTIHEKTEHREFQQPKSHRSLDAIRHMSFQECGGLQGCLRAASMVLHDERVSDPVIDEDTSSADYYSIDRLDSMSDNELASRFANAGVGLARLPTKLLVVEQCSLEEALKTAVWMRSMRLGSFAEGSFGSAKTFESDDGDSV